MKIIVFVFINTILFISISAQTDLTEATKLSAETVKLFQQKKYDEALPLAQRVIEIRRKESGETHIFVAQAWRNLGYIQQQRGKTKEAKQAFENSVEIYEKNQPLSVENEKTLLELLSLTATYQIGDGNVEKVEQKLKRAVELSEKINGKDDLKTADLISNLAQTYQAKLEYEKALPLFLRVLEIKAAKLSPANNETQLALSNAGCALRKSERGEEEITQLTEKYKTVAAENEVNNGIKTINAGIMNGKAMELGKPAYPKEAREKRVSGKVLVEVIIDETGKVIFACAVSGKKELQSGSEWGAYNSKFAPTTLGGKPVKAKGMIVYNFVP